ncbi:hypothetical protein [Fimbriiglobus ruber]|uniref:Biopolymer transport protein ExbD/TolR n=1 Tax=Fimbriiglobus ruber TaxID=1908690 RepID=A0A225DQV1_9BACT|nr:hypothetical protein [Fimbriiglobus ruber]OWK43850.1 hypothetical protein FRUB_03449 [Fimbriiglobus ruber]
MIRAPKQSVTRFFVPLIDVLILLFCIFLLMPFVSHPSTDPADPYSDPTAPAEPEANLKQRIVDLELKLEQSRQEIDRLVKERTDPGSRLSTRVLEIDAKTGRLFYYTADSPDPQEVRDQADAQRLIDQQRRVARGKDVFFLILYPRTESRFPDQRQIDNYRRWFQDVPHGFDNPLSVPAS